jgi:hypothetical protein
MVANADGDFTDASPGFAERFSRSIHTVTAKESRDGVAQERAENPAELEGGESDLAGERLKAGRIHDVLKKQGRRPLGKLTVGMF